MTSTAHDKNWGKLSILPLEILTSIFYHSYLHFKPGPLRPPSYLHQLSPSQWTPCTLSYVCKSWHEIVFSTPFLWNEWFLWLRDGDLSDDEGGDDDEGSEAGDEDKAHERGSLPRLVRLVKNLARLSKDVPVTVQLYFDSSTQYWDDDAPFDTILSLLHTHSRRIEKLLLWGPEASIASLQSPTPINAPILRTLQVINILPFDVVDEEHIKWKRPKPVRLDAPKLQHLFLTETSLVLVDVPLSNIRSITLRNVSLRISRSILQKTGDKLESLGLLDVDPYDFTCHVPEPPLSPSHPSQSQSRSSSSPTQPVFPNLRILEFSCPRAYAADFIHTFFFRDSTPVRTPRLEHFRFITYSTGWGPCFPDDSEPPPPNTSLLLPFIFQCASTLRSFFIYDPQGTDSDFFDNLLEVWAASKKVTVVGYDRSRLPEEALYPWDPDGSILSASMGTSDDLLKARVRRCAVDEKNRPGRWGGLVGWVLPGLEGEENRERDQ